MKTATELLLLLCTIVLYGQDRFTSAEDEFAVPRLYISAFTPEPPVIDGTEDTGIWKQAEWSEYFTDIQGHKTPEYQTRFKMLWDTKNLYVFAKLEEPHIWGTLKKRDTLLYYNNDFEIFLDPDGDTHNYAEIEINALNTVWDLFLDKPYRNSATVDSAWDIKGLKTAVSYQGTLNNSKDTDECWFVEVAIPWKSLKKRGGGKTVPENRFWRMNFLRVHWDFDLKNGKYYRKRNKQHIILPEHHWVWSSQGAINMHLPEKWGYVYFNRNIQNSTTIQLPEDAVLLQWMYSEYRKRLHKPKNSTEKKHIAALKIQNRKAVLEKRVCDNEVFSDIQKPCNLKYLSDQ